MGGSMNWLTTSGSSMPGFPAFTGSGVISSDKELSCNVNTQSTGTGTQANPFRLGTSSAFNSAMLGPTVFIPQAIKNLAGWNSYLAVQNTSSNSAAVQVRYYDPVAGTEIAAAAETATIPANASKIFYQNDNVNLPSGFNASAKVSANDGTSTLAVSVAIYRDATDYTRSQFLSYNGVASGSATVNVPRFVRKILGYNSGMAIQNVGAGDTTVHVVFTFQGSTYTLNTPTIKPNTSYNLYAPNISQLLPVDSLGEALRQGSAVLHVANAATDRIVVSVNEDNQSGIATRLGQGSTYNARPGGSETTTIFFSQFTKNAIGIYNSGFQITNTTSTAGTCNIQYVGTGGAAANETNVTLPAKEAGSLIRYAPQIVLLPNNYNAGVRVTCTQPVVGIVNFSAANLYGDSFTQTTGLNQ